MRTGRPKAELLVTSEEREALECWARRPKTAQRRQAHGNAASCIGERQTS